jgi:hypothetical protein
MSGDQPRGVIVQIAYGHDQRPAQAWREIRWFEDHGIAIREIDPSRRP